MNAGYIHQGTIEESSPAEIQRQFDTNVFGLVSTSTYLSLCLQCINLMHQISDKQCKGLLTTFAGPEKRYYSDNGINRRLA